MWGHLHGPNNRIIEHRLDNVLHQIKAKLTYSEQKTFKTHNEMVMKDLKKKMAADRRYRKKKIAKGEAMPEAHQSATIDLTKEPPQDNDFEMELNPPVKEEPEAEDSKTESDADSTAASQPPKKTPTMRELAKDFADDMSQK